jgi:hypothetical protein
LTNASHHALLMIMKKALWVVIVGLWGCGAAASTAPGDSAAVAPTTRETKVYDAAGDAKACEKPAATCEAPKTDADLQARCTLAGFRMAQCGCEMLCMGKPQAAEKMVFDAEGKSKACAKPTNDCSPPPASAAFQDACTDKGYRLEVCGCEWLCSGNPAK